MAITGNSHGRRLAELEHSLTAEVLRWSLWVTAAGPEAITERWKQVPEAIAHAVSLSLTTTEATCSLASVHRGMSTAHIEQRLQCYPEELQQPIRQMIREQWSWWARGRKG